MSSAGQDYFGRGPTIQTAMQALQNFTAMYQTASPVRETAREWRERERERDVHPCIYLFAYLYIYASIHIYTCKSIQIYHIIGSIHLYIYRHFYGGRCMCAKVCMHACMYAKSMYVCMHACMCVCVMYMNIYICMLVYVYGIRYTGGLG